MQALQNCRQKYKFVLSFCRSFVRSQALSKFAHDKATWGYVDWRLATAHGHKVGPARPVYIILRAINIEVQNLNCLQSQPPPPPPLLLCFFKA